MIQIDHPVQRHLEQIRPIFRAFRRHVLQAFWTISLGFHSPGLQIINLKDFPFILFRGFDFSNGVSSKKNILGGYDYSNCVSSKKNIFGGQDYSNGMNSRQNIFGGQDFTKPGGGQAFTTRPNIFGGFDYSNGGSSRKNIFGGQDYSIPKKR